MIAKTHHMWSIYGSETAVSETESLNFYTLAYSQL